MVEHLFHVPIAYMALLGCDLKVVTRIGSGCDHWRYLKTYPIVNAFDTPTVVRDAGEGVPEGTDFGDLRFAASAPLRTSGGESLGMLVIADFQPRPYFSELDLSALEELASTLATKMELRVIAAQALEAELSLRETEARFRALANSAPVLIISGGPEGGCSFVNRTWLDFTGRELAEELGDGWAESIHPDSRQVVVEATWRALEERKPVTLEHPMRRYDGEYRWMLARGVPRFLDDGTYAGHVACLVDLTDQHRALLAVQKQAQCTEAVANAAGLFYLVTDPYGRIEQVSPICLKTSGIDIEQMRGRPLWESCIAAGQGVQTLHEAIQQAGTSRAPVRLTTEGTTPKGAPLVLWWLITPIVASTGELVALVVTVTEGKKAEQPFRQILRCACG